jgi:dipeptidyl aminopeptidase/acylaminoacyl peptidase
MTSTGRLRPFFLAGFAVLLTAVPVDAQRGGRRTTVVMDTARARELYVSNRWEDHDPDRDYARDMAGKARTDSTFAARARGVVDYQKITYRSRIGDVDVPAYVFQPLQKRGPRGHAAMVWVHGGVHGNMTANYWPFIREAVERGYVIIAPEYRGSTGYGEEHHNAIDYGGYEVDDAMTAYVGGKAFRRAGGSRLSSGSRLPS